MSGVIQIGPQFTATQVIEAGDGNTLINNTGPSTVFFGDSNAILATDAIGTVPVASGGYITVDGQNDLYACVATGTTTSLTLISGGLNFFSPATLSGLGGIKLFVQTTAPTGIIPVNSIWFNTTLNALEYWNGTAWVIQAFSGSQLLQVGTIVANLVAAGTVIAGIVNGTTITGSILNILNAFGAVDLTINRSTGSWLQYADTGSVTQGALIASSAGMNLTDQFGNAVLGGLWTYSNVSGTFYAMGMQGQTIAWESATSAAGPYSALSTISTDLVGTNSKPTIQINGTEVALGSGNNCFWDDSAQSFGLNTAAGPFIPNETFHAISAAAGTSGLLTGGNGMRVKLLPWNAVWLDIEFQNSAANVGGVTFTFGSLPSSAYYPNVSRHFPLSITGNISIAGAIASPRVFVPTSGGIQVVVPTQSAAGTYVASGSIMYPTN